MSKAPSPKPLPQIRSTADFARHVGLARTTVSRVLNGQPGLKPKTIERVQAAMEATGFTPNAYALHLKGKRTATVGICMEDLLTPPAVRKLAALQRLLRERNFASLIEVLDPGHSRRVVRHFLSMRVDAVVFIGHFIEEEIAQRIAELSAHGTPHLVIDHAGITGANTVSLDRARGMVAVVEHLLALGHSTFGLLALTSLARTAQERMVGVRAALSAHGVDFEACTQTRDHLHVRSGDFDYGRALAATFAAEKKRPTAFLALNDEIAVGAIHGFQAAGLRVPQDVSVTGFNNQDICAMATPGLTSVDQQISPTAAAAAELLLAQFNQPVRRKPLLRTISPQLIVRGSTGPARR
ncbi:MAG: LacI family DNA-binding transcriptional regulator [Undibacterium sp.]|nr:LacI family DNA-binding transcriptional regulator [Opitutaceae bacterium]